MQFLINDKDILERINYNDLEAYLKVRNWIKVGSILGKANIWLADDYQINVPVISSLSDYASRMYDVLHILSTKEKRSQIEIYKDIITAYSDIIRIKAESRNYQDGTIPIKSATTLIQGAERILTYSAWSIYDKKPYYFGKPPEAISEFTKQVRMGQTEHGSFITTIHMPINTPKDFFSPIPIPFTRDVSHRLVKALESLKYACETFRKEEQIEIFEEAITDGVNGNLCDAVISMAEMSKQQDLIVNISLSPMYRDHLKDFNPNISTVIPTTNLSALVEASNYYKNRDIEEKVIISGEIIKLGKDNGKSAVLFTDSLDRHMKLRIEMNEQQHDIAIKSYQDELIIRAVGKIKKRGRFYYMEDISEFSLTDDSSGIS